MKHLVLLVHGLTGGVDTFGKFFELLENDKDLKNLICVKKWIFPSKRFSIPFIVNSPRIQVLADALRTELAHWEEESVILVCHSLGGLVAREMILEDVKRNSIGKVRQLVLFATPNTGSDLAKYGVLLSWFQPQLKQLRSDSDFIDSLNEDWDIFNIEEKVKVKYIVGGLDSVVSMKSGGLNRRIVNVETIKDATHSNIVKPINAEDIRYKILKKIIFSFIEEEEKVNRVVLSSTENETIDVSSNISVRQLNPFSVFNLNLLIGREELYSRVNDILKIKNLTILRGISGIGKTTVAKAYLQAYEINYENSAFVEVDDNISESFIRELSNINLSYAYDESLSSLENLNRLIWFLKDIPSTLLILDNCNNYNDLVKTLPFISKLRWSVVITTTCNIEELKDVSIKIEELEPHLAYKLFLKNVGFIQDNDEEVVKRLLQKIYYHTKLIILFAKASVRQPLLKLEELVNLVSEGKYVSDKLAFNVTLEDEERPVYEFILLLFDIDTLDDVQRKYLSYIFISPSQEVQYQNLSYMIDKGEQNALFTDTVNKLIDKGWIERVGREYLKFHPLVKKVINTRIKLEIDGYDNIVDNIIKIFQEQYPEIQTKIYKYVPYASELINLLSKDNNENIAHLCNLVSNQYKLQNKFQAALIYDQLSLQMRKNMYTFYHANVAQSYGYLGVTLTALGRDEEAEENTFEALKIQRKVLPENDNEIATTLINLATLYWRSSISDLSKAYWYVGQAENILINRIEVLDNTYDRLKLAECFILIANIWADMEDFYKTLEYEEKALVILEDFLPKKHYRLAMLYSNITITYMQLNKFNDAEKYIDEAIKIREEILEDNHPELGKSYYNKARVRLKQAVLEESDKKLNLLKDGLHFVEMAKFIENAQYIKDEKHIQSLDVLINSFYELLN